MDSNKLKGIMPTPSKDFRIFEFKILRKTQFEAFDIWERAVIRGREQDSEEVMNWYQSMLDFPETITDNTTYEDYPVLPNILEKYLQ